MNKPEPKQKPAKPVPLNKQIHPRGHKVHPLTRKAANDWRNP